MKRVAVIGLGDRGMAHAAHYKTATAADLVAVVDKDSIKAKKAAKRFSALAFTDARELSTLKVDCATVAASQSEQFSIARWLLTNGIDVFLEQPMADTSGQVRQLMALAREHGRVLQVGHSEAFCPVFQEVEKTLKDPRFLEVRRIVPFSKARTNTDVVMDLMLDDILIVTRLVGRAIKRVEAIGVPVMSETVDIANARLTFVGGVVANFSASRAAARAERTIRVFQPDVYLSLDFGTSVVKFNRKSCRRGTPELVSEQLSFDALASLGLEIDSFLECCELRNPPLVSAEVGVSALEVVEKIRAAFHASFAELDDPSLTVRYGNFLG